MKRITAFGWLAALWCCGLTIITTANDTLAETPQRGRLVACEVTLPASTSVWDIGRDRMQLIGEPRPVDASRTEAVRYWLFIPHTENVENKESGGAPLFLFLHGAGERGNAAGDLERVKVHGVPRRLAEDEVFRQSWQCVTVAPQCKTGHAWSPAQLMLLLDHVEQSLAQYQAIDKSRVYVSGISMGGFGTWMCLQHAPERFAAAAPICGGARPEWAETLREIPIWNFHGDRDMAVPISRSNGIVEAIRRAGGERIVYTVYAGGGHDVWITTYNNQLLYDWFLSQRKKR